MRPSISAMRTPSPSNGIFSVDTTRVSGATDQAGRFAFRGFHGTYDVTLKFSSGKESTVRLEISGKASDLRLVADAQAGTLMMALPPGAP